MYSCISTGILLPYTHPSCQVNSSALDIPHFAVDHILCLAHKFIECQTSNWWMGDITCYRVFGCYLS